MPIDAEGGSIYASRLSTGRGAKSSLAGARSVPVLPVAAAEVPSVVMTAIAMPSMAMPMTVPAPDLNDRIVIRHRRQADSC